MTEQAPHLRITESASSSPFDDRQWRWALRDAGVLACLKGSAPALLLHCYTLADLRTGEFDLPRNYTIGELAMSAKSFDRALRHPSGRGGLLDEGVLEPAGDSPHYPRVKRYRLLTPEAPKANEPTGSRAQKPTANTSMVSKMTHSPPAEAGEGVNFDAVGVAILSADGGNFAPQSAPKVQRESESSSSAPSGKIDTPDPRDAPPPDGSLWKKQSYERAAAAALCCFGPFAWQQAHGLVTQYRPTRRQVLCVLANAYAWRRAARKGEAPPIRDLTAFIKSELKKRKFTLDDRVWQYRELRRRRRKERAGSGGQRSVAGPDDSVDRLSAEQFQRLLAQALDQMPHQKKALEQFQGDRRRARERELVEDQLQRQEAPQ